MTNTLLSQPTRLPTRSVLCTACGGDGKVLKGKGSFASLPAAERILIDCPECEGRGQISVEVPFLVYDRKNKCWIAVDEEGEVIKDPIRDSMNHFEDWEEAQSAVVAYLQKYGVEMKDLKFVDVVDKSPV